jgi:RNA polymerase sigma-70 factor (ECF subfamily)
MVTNPLSNVLRRLRGATALRESGNLNDGQLLTCFLNRSDDTAFEILLHRHGPMVLGVCRRLLRHDQDAEDAFQATFLVLARKAASVVPRERVGNWLYGVAYNTALKARALSAKRRGREIQVKAMPEPHAVRQDPDLWVELQPLLDRELSRLPEMYRFPVVLCDLEGKTHKEAARQLGCPEGTVSVRLSRARALLARRLGARGLTCSVAALATVLSQKAASASLPAALVGPTAEAANLLAAGQSATAGLVSEDVVTLTERVVKTMGMTKLKTLLLVLGTGLLACGLLFAEGLPSGKHPENMPQETRPVGKEKQVKGLKELEGIWKVVSLETEGKKAPEAELKGMRWTFKGSSLHITDETDQAGGMCTVKVDPSKKPKHIDITSEEGPTKGKTVQGIYKLEKGRLIVSVQEVQNAGQGRPTDFTTAAKDGPGVAILERVKDPDRPEKSGAKQMESGGLRDLDGAWRVVALENAGKKVPEEELKVVGWTFHGETLLLSGPGTKIRCSVKVEPGKTPKHIDVTVLDGPAKGMTIPGIYKLDMGRLTICMREGGDEAQGRPKEFATDATNGLGIATLERVRDAEAPAAEDEKKPGKAEPKDLLKEDWGKLAGTWVTTYQRAPDGNAEQRTGLELRESGNDRLFVQYVESKKGPGPSEKYHLHSAVLVVSAVREQNGKRFVVVTPKQSPRSDEHLLRYEFAEGRLRLEGSIGTSKLTGTWSRVEERK